MPGQNILKQMRAFIANPRLLCSRQFRHWMHHGFNFTARTPDLLAEPHAEREGYFSARTADLPRGAFVGKSGG